MDSVSKVEYNVRDLSTRSVILFPTRAQVFRDIKDVPLRPGTNEISIFGLSPTVDEHSIKVEGSGAATIVDINVEPLPNHELFDDVYPDTDEDEDNDSDEEVEDIKVPESAQLIAARLLVRELSAEMEVAEKSINIAESRSRYLNNYCNNINSKHHVDIAAAMDTYKKERLLAIHDMIEARGHVEAIKPKLEAAKADDARLSRMHTKKVSKANIGTEKRRKYLAKQQLKQLQRRAEKAKEKARIRVERERFWPKYCCAVHIKLEVSSTFTPMSSRRGSVSTVTEIGVAQSIEDSGSDPMVTDEPAQTCNLVLSYVTGSAYWSPSYDLQLSTTAGTGVLCFDGQITNNTSEVWEKCKVTLSTSQAASSGLDDKAPSITPWHIKLISKGETGSGDESLLRSREEINLRQTFMHPRNAQVVAKDRANMFGRADPDAGPVAGMPWPAAPPRPVPPPPGASNHALQDYQMQLMLLEQQNKKRLMAARKEQDSGRAPQMQSQENHMHQFPAQPPSMGTQQAQQLAMQQTAQQMQQQQQQRMQQQFAQQQMQQQMQQQQQQQTQQQMQQQMQVQQAADQAVPPQQVQQWRQQAQQADTAQPPPQQGDVLNNFDFDSFLHNPDNGSSFDFGAPELQFQESLIEESGFTTTYDLPGTKTLTPRSHASNHRVARISFSSVPFRHTVLAKYRPAAFLSAKLQNDSKVTLLRGPSGVSLDGSFLGRTTLPRCPAGEFVNINLGVDPAIVVSYPPPEVSKASKGYFAKEDVKAFVRCLRLENKRAVAPAADKGKSAEPAPTKIFVLDQIPVSEDERLRVELIKPEGLTVDGDSKPTGIPGRQLRPEDKNWGRASAHLRKTGVLNWLVFLNPGKAVKLPLEYQVAVPNGEHAVQA